MWDLPGQGLKPVTPALAGRFLTTAPPGKSQEVLTLERKETSGVHRPFAQSTAINAMWLQRQPASVFFVLSFKWDIEKETYRQRGNRWVQLGSSVYPWTSLLLWELEGYPHCVTPLETSFPWAWGALNKKYRIIVSKAAAPRSVYYIPLCVSPSRLWVSISQGLCQFHLYSVFSNTFLACV